MLYLPFDFFFDSGTAALVSLVFGWAVFSFLRVSGATAVGFSSLALVLVTLAIFSFFVRSGAAAAFLFSVFMVGFSGGFSLGLLEVLDRLILAERASKMDPSTNKQFSFAAFCYTARQFGLAGPQGWLGASWGV